MYIEIVTPEAVLFKGEVKSVSVPSVNGQFQILEHHAAVLAILEKGEIKINLNSQKKLEIYIEEKFQKAEEETITLSVNGGTIEQKENSTIILAD